MQDKRSIDTDKGYSYKPFDQYQCIFVHIPKTAGVSISRTLFGNLCGGHDSIKRYQLVFSKREFDSYFKFTVVRNPWSRIFSTYNFLRRGGMTERDRKWAAENIVPYRDFGDFITRWLKRSNIHQYIHFVPQHEFLRVPHNQHLAVDFVGVFENIQDDFQRITNRLFANTNLTLRHEITTASNHKLDYCDFYTNETRDIVADVYKEDVELFGYNFDNSSLRSQLSNRQRWHCPGSTS